MNVRSDPPSKPSGSGPPPWSGPATLPPLPSLPWALRWSFAPYLFAGDGVAALAAAATGVGRRRRCNDLRGRGRRGAPRQRRVLPLCGRHDSGPPPLSGAGGQVPVRVCFPALARCGGRRSRGGLYRKQEGDEKNITKESKRKRMVGARTQFNTPAADFVVGAERNERSE